MKNVGKKLVGKLIEEKCTENINEVKLATITLAEHKNMCKYFFTLYIVLFSVLLTINVGTGAFLFTTNTWFMIKKTVAKEGSVFQKTIYWTYKNDCKKHKYWKPNILIF